MQQKHIWLTKVAQKPTVTPLNVLRVGPHKTSACAPDEISDHVTIVEGVLGIGVYELRSTETSKQKRKRVWLYDFISVRLY